MTIEIQIARDLPVRAIKEDRPVTVRDPREKADPLVRVIRADSPEMARVIRADHPVRVIKEDHPETDLPVRVIKEDRPVTVRDLPGRAIKARDLPETDLPVRVIKARDLTETDHPVRVIKVRDLPETDPPVRVIKEDRPVTVRGLPARAIKGRDLTETDPPVRVTREDPMETDPPVKAAMVVRTGRGLIHRMAPVLRVLDVLPDRMAKDHIVRVVTPDPQANRAEVREPADMHREVALTAASRRMRMISQAMATAVRELRKAPQAEEMNVKTLISRF